MYFYSPRALTKKSSDIGFIQKRINEIPALEVKGDSSGIMFCIPSVHKNGHNYEFLGTLEPALWNMQQADELELHIDNICRKYDINYLNRDDNPDCKIPSIFQIYHKSV